MDYYNLRSRKIRKYNSTPQYQHCASVTAGDDLKTIQSSDLHERHSPMICIRKDLSWKESTPRHMDKYEPLARKALDYYHAEQGRKDFVFDKVTVGALRSGPPRRTAHLNFLASCADGLKKLFFCELDFLSVDSSEVILKGCALLEKVDTGNPLGYCCSLCRGEVIHPGPRDGYIVASGDQFTYSLFWGYRLMSSGVKPKPTVNDDAMYSACAMIALKYYNANELTDYTAVELVQGACRMRDFQIMVHISCSPSGGSSSGSAKDVLFAELSVPMFMVDSSDWDDRKEPFIKVKGCCLLKKIDSGSPFGRHCGMCFDSEVIHPGPREGYSIDAGDGFDGYEFMDIGCGLF